MHKPETKFPNQVGSQTKFGNKGQGKKKRKISSNLIATGPEPAYVPEITADHLKKQRRNF